MLIHKDLQGDAGLPEHAALGGLLRVGNEFMTDRNADSEVQRSGEFVTMKRSSGGFTRLCAIHETPDAWAQNPDSVSPLDDEQYLSAPDDMERAQRTRMFVASVDDNGAELDFARVSAMKAESRMPRFTYIAYSTSAGPEAHAHDRVHDADYATQAGKRRLFSLGDGRALLVRELAKENDDRWYMGVARGLSTFSRRRKRTARVELTAMDPETGAMGKTLMGFDIHSGLGFDPYQEAPNHALNGGRPYRSRYVFNNGPTDTTLPFYQGDDIYMAMTGAMWGRIAIDGVAGDAGIQADASDTYAVAEPAYAPNGQETYLCLVAVHPAAGDTHDPLSAGPYRLTCTRTTPAGEVVQSKISFPAIAGAPNHYYGATGMELVRTSPTNLVLIAHVHAMQSAYPGTISPAARSRLFFWSANNGESWTYAPVSTTAPDFPLFPYSSHLVQDADTLLVFSHYDAYSTVPVPDRDGVQVHAVTRAGTAYVSTIPGVRFNAGLRTPYVTGGKHDYNTPYIGFGYGGAVAARGKRRLWMQFDPRWIEYSRDKMLQSPPSRPQLLTSDDGGLTWERRFLPTVWQHLVGFVVAIDRKTLAVPVFAPRRLDDQGDALPAKARVYLSHDGGVRWRPTQWTLAMPGFAWVDGALLPGRLDGTPSLGPGADEYDIDDSGTDYSRGELFPLVALHDETGRLSPINPARPWIADARIKEPASG